MIFMCKVQGTCSMLPVACCLFNQFNHYAIKNYQPSLRWFRFFISERTVRYVFENLRSKIWTLVLNTLNLLLHLQ